MQETASSLYQYTRELKISVCLRKLLWSLELDLTIPVLYSFVINFPLPSVSVPLEFFLLRNLL